MDLRIKKIRSYIIIPMILVNFIISKIFNIVTALNILSKILEAKIDDNNSYVNNYSIVNKGEIELISIKDINSSKMRFSLRISGIFNRWFIYYIKTFSDNNKSMSYNNNRDLIYLSKHRLDKDDLSVKFRIPDYTFYNKKNAYELDKIPEVFVMVAKKTYRHDEIRQERKLIREERMYKHLKKEVISAISISNHNIRKVIRLKNTFNDVLLFHEIIRQKYIDLVELFLNGCKDDIERRYIVNLLADKHGESNEWYGNSAIDVGYDVDIIILLSRWGDESVLDNIPEKIKEKIKVRQRENVINSLLED